jgi:hypothetical protein
MSDLQSYGLWEFAVLTDNLDAAKLLIDVGVNPDIRHPAVNTTVLMIATWSKSFAVAKMQLLVDAGVDPLALTESDGMSALDFAMAEGNLDAITKMLEWIDAAGPESYDLVRRAIDGGEQEGDEYVDVLRGWLSEREAPQTQASE